MPRIKSIPNHRDFYILKKVKKLPDEIILLIYTFTNRIVKLIINPKWDWYLKNINFKYYNLKHFYYKILLRE